MIHEIRTYRITPGSLPEVEKRFAEAYEHRKQYSPLTAFLHTEIGPLNEIVHIWSYDNHEERARVRAEAAKNPNWPPKLAEFIVTMRSEIVMPLDFVPPVPKEKVGPVFELRYYTLKPGMLPDMLKGWKEALPGRIKLSPLVMAGTVEFGQANGFIHLWAYPSLNARMETREGARKQGIWPPPSAPGRLLFQDNKILLPASFSPLQ